MMALFDHCRSEHNELAAVKQVHGQYSAQLDLSMLGERKIVNRADSAIRNSRQNEPGT
jgi:hypothetical protein